MVVPSRRPLDAGAVRDSSSTSLDEQWWPIARQLGLRLQRARIAKGLSQEALAHAAGISEVPGVSWTVVERVLF